ncbi:MAG: galactose mutarotase [Bacteroidaceae bacterium]|nr:galactose mutarotase [Bacteroidaceae bacterium]
MKKSSIILMAGMLAMASCNQKDAASAEDYLNKADFQTEFTGKQTDLFKLTNANKCEVWVTNFGARIVAILVPDKDGKMQDVVIGFKNIQDYTTLASDFGSTVGRYANRINQGKITVDGVTYQLPQNNFGHCLHGGCDITIPQGWQNLVWDVKEVSDNSITLVMNAPDGETANEAAGIDGFPGNVVATATYTLNDNNAIDIVWKATTDAKTVINMTNHSYFNLNGDHSLPITNHILTLAADNFTPVDDTYMTTGEIASVEGTPMDFRQGRRIGEAIEGLEGDAFEDVQLRNGNGYDHNWVLNTKGNDTQCCAKLYSPITGIFVEVYTNEPGIQFYSGNFLDGSGNDKQGNPMTIRTGCCLETQKFPDSPNKSNLEGWYSAELEPGQEYYSHCIYQFGAE